MWLHVLAAAKNKKHDKFLKVRAINALKKANKREPNKHHRTHRELHIRAIMEQNNAASAGATDVVSDGLNAMEHEKDVRVDVDDFQNGGGVDLEKTQESINNLQDTANATINASNENFDALKTEKKNLRTPNGFGTDPNTDRQSLRNRY